MSPIRFIAHILILWEDFAFSVTSWLRTLRRNALVNGHPGSMHKKGLAVDVVLDDVSKTWEFLEAIKALGLVAVVEKDHIHIQVKEGGDKHASTQS